MPRSKKKLLRSDGNVYGGCVEAAKAIIRSSGAGYIPTVASGISHAAHQKWGARSAYGFMWMYLDTPIADMPSWAFRVAEEHGYDLVAMGGGDE